MRAFATSYVFGGVNEPSSKKAPEAQDWRGAHPVFARSLLAAMRLSIDLGIVTDKVVLIQAFALMTMFRDGRNGHENSSQLCGRAVHHLQSLGLHTQGRHYGPEED